MSTKRNSIYNIAGPLISVAVMLATVPLYLGLIGEARFGIMAIIWLLTTYFVVFDMGMGRIATYNLSRLEACDLDGIRATFWTGLAINAGFGIIGAVLVWLLATPIFEHFINLTPDLKAELFPVLPLVALGIPGLIIENMLNGAMAGRQRFFALNIRVTMSTLLAQIIPLIAVWTFSPTLDTAVPAVIAARWIAVALSLIIAVNSLGLGWKLRWGGREMAMSMIGMGKWLAMADGLRMQLAGLDRIMIGAYLNAVSVTRYTVPYQLTMRGTVFANAMPNALFPRLANTNAEDRQQLALRGLKANAAMMLVLCTIGMIAMRPFLSWWIDETFASHSAIVGQIIVVSLWLNAVGHVPFNLIQAQGRVREIALLTAAQFIPFLLLAYPGMWAWGIAGMALARTTTALIELLLMSWRAQMFRHAAIILLPSIAFLTGELIITQLSELQSAIGAIAAITLILASILGAVAISPDLRHLIEANLPFRPNR